MRSKEVKGTKSAISSKIFNELAAKNVKKSAKDYFIYFFTLMLSVCLFYSFNSISTQFTSLGLEDKLNYLAFSSSMLTAFSILVCFIMGGLVVYANRFLLRRRKKEMGIYATLGMERNDLNKLLMKETLRIGIFSLVAGIGLGIFAAQILSLLTARLAGLSLTSYHFMISFKAIVLSILFFGILFFLVHQFNKRELRKMSLLDMLNADRKNDVIAPGRGSGWIVAVLSIILLAGGYAVIFIKADENVFKALGLGGILLMAGTLLFFTSAFKIAAKLMKSNKKSYFRGLNMFTASQFSSRFRSEGRSVAMIAVLLFLSLTLTIVGPGIGKYVINGIENAAPYDGSISYAVGVYGAPKTDEPLGYLEKNGFHIEEYSDSYEAVWIYQTPSVTFELLTGGGALSEHENRIDGDEDEESSQLNIIGDEDYNRLLSLQGKEPVRLEEGAYAVTYAFPASEKTMERFADNPGDIKIGADTLTLAPEGIYQTALENKNILSEQGTIIVPQSITENLTPVRWCLDFNFRQSAEDIHSALYDGWLEAATDGFIMWAREEAIVSITADNLLTTYLGLYLGITFLITAGAVLAIRQLSQSSDNVARYGLLKKLGASRKDMKRSLMKQLRLYFGLPLLIAVIHTVVVLAVVFRLFEGLALSAMLSIIGGGILLIFTVYAVYFITTYLGSKRILQLR